MDVVNRDTQLEEFGRIANVFWVIFNAMKSHSAVQSQKARAALAKVVCNA